MISLTTNMDAVNAILQHPDIWPDIAGGIAPFDTPFLPHVLYFLVNDGDGVITFHDYRDGLKIHPNILPSKRGKLAYDAVEEAVQTVFSRGCPCVYAEIPRLLRNVTLFARQLGFNLLETGKAVDLFVRRNLDS
ncbi:MAG: hypothetical protein IIB77_02105 [Proteobacteria bacterium]|nr:hypothetical protein [Pseudomonadota bacterium]